jgi:outer membrane protease
MIILKVAKRAFALASWAVIVALVPLGAQTGSGYPVFSAQVGTGVTAGTADEVVYADQSSLTKLSELLWPIPLSPVVWAQVNAAWAPLFETSLRFTTAIPITTGNMSDNDWNPAGTTVLTDSDGNLLSTMHSDSTAYLTADWALRLEASVPLRADWFDWKLVAGLDYHHLAWEAWNTTQTATLAVPGAPGYDSSGAQTVSLTGMSAIFRQEWILAYVGAGVTANWFGIDWALDLRVSPFPIVNQTDAHILRQLTFNENLTGGFMVEPGLSASWPLLPNVTMSANLTYQGIFFLRGAETESGDGLLSSDSDAGFYSFANGAGAGLQTWNFGLSWTLGLGTGGGGRR